MGKQVITVGGNTYKLVFDEFDEEMDIDDLLKIDYSNLIGEMITFPVIVNRFGNLLAEAESQVAEAKLSLEVYEAKTKEKLRIELSEANGGKNPTVDALNNALISTKAYQAFRKRHIEAMKTRDFVSSTFWSAKDKSAKLDKLSLTVQESDLSTSVVEGRVNKVLIKRAKGKLIE